MELESVLELKLELELDSTREREYNGLKFSGIQWIKWNQVTRLLTEIFSTKMFESLFQFFQFFDFFDFFQFFQFFDFFDFFEFHQ
jgi:hypothetical protein